MKAGPGLDIGQDKLLPISGMFSISEIADLQVAYDRLLDTTDPIISIEDMRKELEL